MKMNEIGVKPGQQIVPICPFTPMANEKKVLWRKLGTTVTDALQSNKKN